MTDYAANWNNYYRKTYGLLKSKSLWEVDPKLAAEVDRLHFHTYLSYDLPIIDMGCGTGEQAIYLKQYYPKVIGLDVAQEAIAIARQRYQHQGVEFAAFDIADSAVAHKLFDENGPCHIYMRGVLHQTLPEDKARIQETIHALLGDKGRLYFIEVADNIRSYLSTQVSSFSELPDSMKEALMSNLPPIGISLNRLTDWFPETVFKIICSGEEFLATNLLLPDQSRLKIPAIFGVIGNKN